MSEEDGRSQSTDSRAGIQGTGIWAALQSFMIVVTCTLAMIVNTANSTAPQIAIPTISRELNVNPIDIVWIVSAYALSSGCLLLLSGRLADLYGRKKVYTLGNLWLVAFTLACSFAKDAKTLSVLRGFEGVGASATIPAAIGILAHHFPPSRARSVAFATFAAGAPVGGSCGQALGAVLTQLSKKTWRGVFYLNAGLAFLSLVIGVFFIERDTPSEELDRRVDWIGAFLATAGLTFIVFVLGQGDVAPRQWATGYIIGLLVAGVILILVFLLWQHYLEQVRDHGRQPNAVLALLPTPPPIMKLSLWTRGNGKVAAVMCIAFLNWCCFLSWSYWAMLYYQDYKKLTPILTMVRLLPMPISGLICNAVVALVVHRVPVVYLMSGGAALTGLAALLFAVTDPNASYWAFGFPAAIVSVVGADFIFSTGTIYVAKMALPHELSLAGGVFQCMTQLGTSMGISISTVVVHQLSSKSSESNTMEEYSAAQWTNLGFGLSASLLALVFLRNAGTVGHNDKESESTTTEVESVDEKRHSVKP